MSRVPRRVPRRRRDLLTTGGLKLFAAQGRIRLLSVERGRFEYGHKKPGLGNRINSGRVFTIAALFAAATSESALVPRLTAEGIDFIMAASEPRLRRAI
jgi:hypothetical protein